LWSTDGSTFNATSVAATGNVTMANSGFFFVGAGANNQSSVTTRVYAYAGDRTGRSAFGSSGTFRIDNLTVFARTITSSKTLLDYPAIGLSMKSGTAFTPKYTDFAVNGSSITVSLASALQLSGTLSLTNGIVTMGSNTLTASGAITGGSSAAYVNGKLARVYSGISSKSFPIGNGGNFRPLTLNYTALTDTSTVTAEQFETALTGTLPPNTTLFADRFWNVS
jgi:hypothetical protein